MACYVRSMTLRSRLVALLAAVALATAACGASTATVDQEPDTESDGSDNTESDVSDDGVVSLGDREVGFGPGSLAVPAGSIVDRLWDVEGDWFVGQPFIQFDLPEVCGYLEPLATQGISLSRVDPEQNPFGDGMVAQVLVYETPDEAASQLDLLNGPSAEECDLASLEVAKDTELLPPGVEFDAGSGVGVPIDAPEDLVEEFGAVSRQYVGSLNIGSVEQELVQLEFWFASDRYLVRSSATSAVGNEEAVQDDMISAFLAEPFPTIDDSAELDSALNTMRASVLDDSALPELFEFNDGLAVFRRPDNDDSCYARPDVLASTDGPQWLAISPGVGGSEIVQGADLYSDEATAAAVFDRFVELGADCYAEVVGLPDVFRLVGSAFETQELNGRTIALVKLDYIQLVGAQEFEVEVAAAVVQEGAFSLRVIFFGLAGDSPDLAALLSIAADQAAQ